MVELTHAHCFLPGSDAGKAPLVLLHGSGGSEGDLMALAGELAPGAARLGVRGTVEIDGGYAFFDRFPDRRVDEADLAARVPELAEFIEACCAGYGVAGRPVAIGFSNGAIMAAALLLMRPGLLAGAVLFRPLCPFGRDLPGRLDGTPVLILDGAKDARRSPGDGARLAERLGQAGAVVTHHVLEVGHGITGEDRGVAGEWIRGLKPSQTGSTPRTIPRQELGIHRWPLE